MDANTTFTERSNAIRAAKRVIAAGRAPASEFDIRPSADGRYEIVWLTAQSTTEQIETEIATAAARSPELTPNERADLDAFAAGEPAKADPEHAPPAAATEKDPELAAFETPRLVAELARRGYRSAPAP